MIYFLAGVLSTILVEMLLLILYALRRWKDGD